MDTVPALQTRGLEVRLGSTRVLKGVDLSVQRGDLYGLLGRNGAGKTTAMRCMLGFLPGYKGTCEIFGHSSLRIHTVPHALGVALDPPGLDDTLTVRQNLELARIRSGVREGRSVDEVLDLVGLVHRQNNKGNRLSHGQGRRAAVARALLGTPTLLILDEPLSGLDPEGVEELLELFLRLTRDEGVTVVLSSHHLREVQEVCNRVGLIEDGRVILEGETASLLAEAGDVLIIHCRNPQPAEALLKAESSVLDCEVGAGGRIRARIQPDCDLANLLLRLANGHTGLEEFRRERATLVDVFRRAVS